MPAGYTSVLLLYWTKTEGARSYEREPSVVRGILLVYVEVTRRRHEKRTDLGAMSVQAVLLQPALDVFGREAVCLWRHELHQHLRIVS